jgi:malate dehydrogenase
MAQQELGDVVLVDIPMLDGRPQGIALDLAQAAPLHGYDVQIVGASDYAPTAGSDVVIIAAGVGRKPGMKREQLAGINASVVKAVAQSVAQTSPNAVLIVVSNPLDVMAYVAWKASGFPPRRVVGQAGALGVARLRSFVAQEIGCSVQDVQALVLGGQGEEMVPLLGSIRAGGIPVTQLIAPERIEQIIRRTRAGGDEIVHLLRTGSASYAPAAATAAMVQAVVRDKKRILPCAAWCDGEYGVSGLFVGVPCLLGAGGVERVIEVEMTQDERSAFARGVQRVREQVAALEA